MIAKTCIKNNIIFQYVKKMSTELAKILCMLVDEISAKFTLYGKAVTNAEIFSDVGLLPALAKRADQLCSLCLGYSIGATFTEVEKATLGSKVQFDEVTPDVLRLLCILDVIYELVRVGPSKDQKPLDELMYD